METLQRLEALEEGWNPPAAPIALPRTETAPASSIPDALCAEIAQHIAAPLPPWRMSGALGLFHCSWPRTPRVESLCSCPPFESRVSVRPTPGATAHEQFVLPRPEGTATTSLSLQRSWDTAPESRSRGSANSFPFLPGGMDPRPKQQRGEGSQSRAAVRPELAPGFARPIDMRPEGERAAPLPAPKAKREESSAGGAAETQGHAEAAAATDAAAVSLESVFRGGAPGTDAELRSRAPRSADDSDAEPEDDDDDDLSGDEVCEAPGSAAQQPDADGAERVQAVGGKDGEGDDIDGLLEEFERHWRNERKLGGGAVAADETLKRAAREWAVEDTTDVSEWDKLVPEPAIKFPFELDTFQKRAVYHLERNECVFVAAHTSAGKTLVAEYAIALATKHMTRAIYTSPIKALSNQKFRDFKETFGDVGLITGDVSIAPESSCLIVTTEILRSMLYRGADIVRDIEWVIFDEVHYVNDAERGVVWEEVIIMLPDHVNLIMLSATVPNAMEFADWIGRTKRKKIHVISTPKRPVPLEHYVYAGAGELTMIVDSSRNFLRNGYQKAKEVQKQKEEKSKVKGKRWGGAQSRTHWTKFAAYLKKQALVPVVVFVFSKKRCEECAYGLSGVDMTADAKEKSDIHHFIEASISRLKEADRKLPQILGIKELLKRGLGVHHGGLLPIVKEMVEILFAKGFVKLLFATETFAMGVNMPTRTVVFSQLRKWDGKAPRDLLPGEYTQMSGRAGRRGKDPAGTVIIDCVSELPDAATMQQIILGVPTKLTSQFRLTFNMILNLLRIEDLKVEDMMKRSFSEASSQKAVPKQQSLLMRGETKLARLKPIECLFGECSPVEEYAACADKVGELDREIRCQVIASRQAASLLSPGRIIALESRTHYAPGTYAAVHLVQKSGVAAVVLDPQTQQCTYKTVKPAHVKGICKCKINLDPNVAKMEFMARPALQTAAQYISKLVDDCKTGALPMYHPVKEIKINDLAFTELMDKRAKLDKSMVSSPCHTCVRREEHLKESMKRIRLREKVKRLRYELSDDNLLLMPDFQSRLEVLQRTGYIDSDHSILIKGRVAREINTCDELLATELIFENAMADLDPPELVALLSAMVFEDKSSDVKPETLPPNLKALWDLAVDTLKQIAQVEAECGMLVDIEELIKETLNCSIMEVVYEWARQVPFSELCKLTLVQEGTIVRCIVRLDETCKEIKGAARVIGDPALFQKADEASKLIKRDIVFATSLYVA
eukprot:m51a1_g8762 putative helicase ski2w (1240) ;mRNA; f:131606-136281